MVKKKLKTPFGDSVDVDTDKFSKYFIPITKEEIEIQRALHELPKLCYQLYELISREKSTISKPEFHLLLLRNHQMVEYIYNELSRYIEEYHKKEQRLYIMCIEADRRELEDIKIELKERCMEPTEEDKKRMEELR